MNRNSLEVAKIRISISSFEGFEWLVSVGYKYEDVIELSSSIIHSPFAEVHTYDC